MFQSHRGLRENQKTFRNLKFALPLVTAFSLINQKLLILVIFFLSGPNFNFFVGLLRRYKFLQIKFVRWAITLISDWTAFHPEWWLEKLKPLTIPTSYK